MTELSTSTGPAAGELLAQSAESLRQAAAEAAPGTAGPAIERLLDLIDLLGPALPHRRAEHVQKAAREALDRLKGARRWERSVAGLRDLRDALDEGSARAAVEHVLDFAQRRARRTAPRALDRHVGDLAGLCEDLAKKAREPTGPLALDGVAATAEAFEADDGSASSALAAIRTLRVAWATSSDGAASPFRAALETVHAGLERVVAEQGLGKLLARRIERLRGRGLDALLAGLERAADVQAARLGAAVAFAREALRSAAGGVAEAAPAAEPAPTAAEQSEEAPTQTAAPKPRRSRRAAAPTE